MHLMGVIKLGYPRFYEGFDDMSGAVDMWASMFVDYPYELVLEGYRRFANSDTKGYPPVVGQIMHEINEIRQPAADIPSEAEAWEQIKRAVSNGLYNAGKEFDKLHPILKRLVGGPDTIYRWANMDEESIDMNIRPMICRSYNQYAERERADRLLPPSMQKNVQALRDAARPASLTAPVYERPDDPPGEEQQPAKPEAFSGPGFEKFMAGMKALAAQMAIDEAERWRIEITDPDAEARAWAEEKAREIRS